jgi:hypothetical protein
MNSQYTLSINTIASRIFSSEKPDFLILQQNQPSVFTHPTSALSKQPKTEKME